jgi:thymidylate synthase (FAD)
MTIPGEKLIVVEPHAEMITPKYDGRWAENALALVEECGRVSHKSEGRIKPGSAEKFIRKVGIKWRHESILEHAVFTACFVGSRAMSHQLVRHRLAAYTQESQRFCDYAPTFGLEDPPEGERTGALRVIVPPSIVVLPEGTVVRRLDDGVTYELPDETGIRLASTLTPKARTFLGGLLDAYGRYLSLRRMDVPAEDARHLLPNATKTEVYTTFNLRQWRHVFKMRLDSHAQWEIRRCVREVFEFFRREIPLVTEEVRTLGGEPVE